MSWEMKQLRRINTERVKSGTIQKESWTRLDIILEDCLIYAIEGTIDEKRGQKVSAGR